MGPEQPLKLLTQSVTKLVRLVQDQELVLVKAEEASREVVTENKRYVHF
jgi:hypothetical protein